MQGPRIARILKLCALVIFVSVALVWGRPAGPATAAFTDLQVRQVDSLPIENPAPLENGRLAFQRFESGSRDIYTIDAGGLHRLTDGPSVIDPPSLSPPAEPTSRRSLNGAPAFSPDGSQIAFISNRDGEDNWEIYVMNADGSGVARITNIPGYEGPPKWSPDGSQIAYASHREGNWEIYVMNADGGGHTNLSKHPSSDNWPTWSPDGTKIAFTSNRGENPSIYVMNTDGSGVTQLTSGTPRYDGTPAWSPDGTKIAFVRAHDDLGWLNGEIYVMNSDGSGQTRLTTNTIDEGEPTWSPDGSKIAFVASGRLPPAGPIYDLHIMNADGSGRTALTEDTSIDDQMPSWSGPAPLDSDSDGDGCSDVQEAGSQPEQGGMRDPSNFWDFTDQWVGGGRDRTVNGFDIGAVVIRFGSAGDPDDDPLDPPTTQDGYHVSGDRSPPPIGLNSWNAGPADGTIDGFDIASVIVQFGHTCA